MKNLLFLLLGIISMIAISATTVSVMTVKPAQPKNTIAFLDHGNPSSKILKYAKEGYIVKSLTANGYSVSSRILVVMEKY